MSMLVVGRVTFAKPTADQRKHLEGTAHPVTPEMLTQVVGGPADLLDTPLPCDADCGGVVFRKGVKLRTLVDAAKRWKAMAGEALVRDSIERARAAGADFHKSVGEFSELTARLGGDGDQP